MKWKYVRINQIIVVFYLQVESIVTRCLWFLSSDRVLLACSSAWVSLQLIFLSNEVDFTIAAEFVKLLPVTFEEVVRSCSSDDSFLLQIWWALSTWLFSIIEVGELVDAAWFDELFSLVALLVWPVWTREAKALASFWLKLFLINPLFSSQSTVIWFWWWFSGLLLKLWLLFTFWFVWWILWRQLSDLERKLDLCGKVTLLKDFLMDWHTLPLPALSLEFCWLLVVWCGGCVWLFWLFVLTFGFKHFGRCKAVLIKDADLVRSKWRFQRSEIWKKHTVRKCSFNLYSFLQ